VTEHRLTASTYAQGSTTVLTYRCSGCSIYGHTDAEDRETALALFAAVAREHNTPSLFDQPA